VRLLGLWDHVPTLAPGSKNGPQRHDRDIRWSSHLPIPPHCHVQNGPLLPRPVAQESSRIPGFLTSTFFFCQPAAPQRPLTSTPSLFAPRWDAQPSDLADKLWARAEANGYSPGAHTERDRVRGKGKHGDRAIQNHDTQPLTSCRTYPSHPPSFLSRLQTHSRDPISDLLS